MNVQSWLKYFDSLGKKEEKYTHWKFQNISKNVKGEALKIYINECLDCTRYDQIADFLTKNFFSINIPNFYEFSALKLEDMSELENYFYKKVGIGRKLRLCETTLLQGLTDENMNIRII